VELEGRGVTLNLTPQGNIRCKPKDALTPEDVARLKEYKQDIIKVLTPTARVTVPAPRSPQSPQGDNADTCGDLTGDGTGDGMPGSSDTVPTPESDGASEIERQHQRVAEALGFVSRLSYEFDYITIHDPTTGEWHDVPTKSAPAWAKTEAFKRRELRKDHGVRRFLNREELEEVWEEEHGRLPERIDKNTGAVTSKGIVYEDYLSGDE